MLRPSDLASSDYGVALRPTQGYAEKLLVSNEQSVELGALEIVAANSGVYTADTANNLALADNPQEVLVTLETPASLGANGATLVVSFTGTYSDDSAMTGTATLKVPVYAKDQSAELPSTISAEVIRNDLTKDIKTLVYAGVTAGVTTVGVRISVFGLPGATSFQQIACKENFTWNPKTQDSIGIRCGKDPNAFVLPGDIMDGTLDVTAKVQSEVDGLMRVMGRRCTGKIIVTKEDVLPVMHVYLLGLVIGAKRTAPEGADPSTITGTGKYEDAPILWAQ